MNMTNNKGFTLAEVIIVIFFIIVLSAVSMPLVSDTLDQYQFTNSMRLLLSTMNRAKGEAVNTSFPCSVLFTTDANGRVNYTAFVDNGNGGGISGNGLRDGTEQLISDGQMPRGVTINSASTTLPTINISGNNCPFTQFNSLGFPIGFQAGASAIYSGNIRMNTVINGTLRSREIRLGIGGNLFINPNVL